MLAVAHRACVAVDDYGADIEVAHGLDGDRGERLIDLYGPPWPAEPSRPRAHQLYSRRMLARLAACADIAAGD